MIPDITRIEQMVELGKLMEGLLGKIDDYLESVPVDQLMEKIEAWPLKRRIELFRVLERSMAGEVRDSGCGDLSDLEVREAVHARPWNLKAKP